MPFPVFTLLFFFIFFFFSFSFPFSYLLFKSEYLGGSLPHGEKLRRGGSRHISLGTKLRSESSAAKGANEPEGHFQFCGGRVLTAHGLVEGEQSQPEGCIHDDLKDTKIDIKSIKEKKIERRYERDNEHKNYNNNKINN